MSSATEFVILGLVSLLIPADFIYMRKNNTVNFVFKKNEQPYFHPQDQTNNGNDQSAQNASHTAISTLSFLNKPSGDNYTQSDVEISDSHLMNDLYLHNNSLKRMDVPIGGTRNSQPFGFEYKNPHPSPFQINPEVFPRPKKNQTAEIKSIEQIVRLLSQKMFENGFMNLNPKRRVKFSGVYLNPLKSDEETDKNSGIADLEDKDIGVVSLDPLDRVSSINGHAYNTDPLFQYKPTELGDINLLAENKFRFSPSFEQTRFKKKECYEPRCFSESAQENKAGLFVESDIEKDIRGSEDAYYENIRKNSYGKPKHQRTKRPFSVLVDIYPVGNRYEDGYQEHYVKEPIYTTTSTTTQASVKLKQKQIFYPKYNPYNVYSQPYYQYHSHHRPIVQHSLAQAIPQIVQLPYAIYPLQNLPPINVYRNQVSKTNYKTPVQMMIYLNLYPKNNAYEHQRDDEFFKRMDTDSNKFDYHYSISYPRLNSSTEFKDEIFDETKINQSENMDSKDIIVKSKGKEIEFMIPGSKVETNT